MALQGAGTDKCRFFPLCTRVSPNGPAARQSGSFGQHQRRIEHFMRDVVLSVQRNG